MPKLQGFQIVESETDDPPKDMTTYQVYPLKYCLEWISQRPDHEQPLWRLLPVFTGDIHKPTFPQGKETVKL